MGWHNFSYFRIGRGTIYMDNKVRQVCTSKTALDARGHKSDIGCRVRIPVWLCLFVLLFVVGWFLIFLFHAWSCLGIGINFARNAQVLCTHGQRGQIRGVSGRIANCWLAKIHFGRDTSTTSWLAQRTQKVAVTIDATAVTGSSSNTASVIQIQGKVNVLRLG